MKRVVKEKREGQREREREIHKRTCLTDIKNSIIINN